MQEIQAPSLDQEDPLEEEMTTHPSILAWKIPWTEDPGGLKSMGSQRVRRAWVTKQGGPQKGLLKLAYWASSPASLTFFPVLNCRLLSLSWKPPCVHIMYSLCYSVPVVLKSFIKRIAGSHLQPFRFCRSGVGPQNLPSNTSSVLMLLARGL